MSSTLRSAARYRQSTYTPLPCPPPPLCLHSTLSADDRGTRQHRHASSASLALATISEGGGRVAAAPSSRSVVTPLRSATARGVALWEGDDPELLAVTTPLDTGTAIQIHNFRFHK